MHQIIDTAISNPLGSAGLASLATMMVVPSARRVGKLLLLIINLIAVAMVAVDGPGGAMRWAAFGFGKLAIAGKVQHTAVGKAPGTSNVDPGAHRR